MDIYREDVLDHYNHPRNKGLIDGENVLTGSGANASCGDSVVIHLKISGGKIIEMKWEGSGCAISTAAASKLSQYLQGRTLKEVTDMSEEELTQKAIGIEVNPGRIKCLLLPGSVVKKML